MTHLEDFEDDCSPENSDNTTNEVDTYLIASCGKSRVIIDGGDGGGDDPDPPSDAGGGVVVDQDDDGGDPPDPPVNPPGPRPGGGGDGGGGDGGGGGGGGTPVNPAPPRPTTPGGGGGAGGGGGTPVTPAPPQPVNPTTPGDVECCLWTCIGNQPQKFCKKPEDWRAIYPGTTTAGWECSNVFNAAPFTGTDGRTYSKNPQPCDGLEPGVAPGVGVDDGGGGGGVSPTTPGAGPQQGGVNYDVCYRWVCQNGTPIQIGRTINYWRSFTGQNLQNCGDLPASFKGPNGKLYSTNPAVACPPGDLDAGVVIDFGGGGNGTPIGDPGGIAGGSVFDGGGGGVGTGLDGDFVAGDFDPFDPPDSGGGGLGGGNPYSWGGGTADGTIFDPPNGGGGIKGSGTSLDIDPFGDSGQQFDTQNRIGSGDVADSYVQYSPVAYDKNNNIVFTRDPERLAFLRAAANNPLFSDNSIFKKTVYRTLATVFDLTVNRGKAVYNGEEISAFCYDDEVITDSLKITTADILKKINTANSSSYRFSNYITKALRNAVLRGVIGDYTLDFLREIGAGYNDINPEVRADNIEVATGYIAQFRKSLYPKNYSKGESQRRVQMWHALPSDIDLKTSIRTYHGDNVCIRVDDTDDIKIPSRDGGVKQVATKNEFYTVIQQDGSEKTVNLYSKRKQAYALDLPKLSVAHSLFGGRAGRFGRNGDYNFILKTQTPYEDEVEVSATSTTLKEAYLIKLDKRSIGDVNNDTQYFRQTSATYNLVWEEGDSEEVFTSSVEDYYGPRQVVYVNGRDPFWNHFLAASSVSATYNDLKIDGLLGGIYPRVLNMDILLVPTDQVRYDPYQGNSKLDQYESGKPVIRSLKIVTSPVRKSLGEVYAQLDFDTRRVARQGGTDNYAVKSIKGYSDGYFRKVASNDTTLRTDRSIVGRFVNVINRVKENYNLGGRGSGLSLPQRDLYSFMKPREVAEFLIRIPQHIRNSIINGDYTGVRVFAVTNLDREKTFLTPAREKVSGVNLDDERLFKEIQDISSRYFKDIR